MLREAQVQLIEEMAFVVVDSQEDTGDDEATDDKSKGCIRLCSS